MNILIGRHILVFLHLISNILLSSPSMHRYMIDASSKKSIEESFEAIGSEIGIDGNTNSVIRWLSRLKEEWILLFDNADNPNVPLKSFFPRLQHGNILITTRNADFSTLAQVALWRFRHSRKGLLSNSSLGQVKWNKLRESRKSLERS